MATEQPEQEELHFAPLKGYGQGRIERTEDPSSYRKYRAVGIAA